MSKKRKRRGFLYSYGPIIQIGLPDQSGSAQSVAPSASSSCPLPHISWSPGYGRTITPKSARHLII